MTKNPHSTLFWNDLENDAELKTCSLAAKGLWTCHLLPIAARSPEPGVVTIGSWPSKVGADLAMVLSNVVGGSADVLAALIDELVNSGAASVDAEGRLFNRRMVRAAKLSEKRSAAGRTGARSRWQTDGKTGATPGWQTDGKHHGKRDGKTPSASPTVSDGKDTTIPAKSTTSGCDGDSKPMHSSILREERRESLTETPVRAESAPDDGKKATRLPVDWRPEGELRDWTLEAIRKAGSSVSAGHELEKFRDHWKASPGAKGRKADWPATWRNWIRKAIEMENKGNGSIYRQGARPQARRRTGAENAAAFAAAFSVPRDRGSSDDDGGA